MFAALFTAQCPGALLVLVMLRPVGGGGGGGEVAPTPLSAHTIAAASQPEPAVSVRAARPAASTQTASSAAAAGSAAAVVSPASRVRYLAVPGLVSTSASLEIVHEV
jgi:hypothetical protein